MSNLSDINNEEEKNRNNQYAQITIKQGMTGSGKTHSMLTRIKAHLKSENNKKIIIMALASKDAVERASSYLLEEFPDARKKRDLLTYISGDSQTNKLLFLQSEDNKTKFKQPKVILTTHAYLRKRGDSNYIYQFQLDMLWLADLGNELELLIDEGHIYLDSLVWSLKTKGYYQETAGLNNTKIIKPIKNVKYSEQVIDTSEAYTKDTEYILRISPTSHNPEIQWDKGILSGEHSFKGPGMFYSDGTVSASFLDIAYSYIRNKDFNIENPKLRFSFMGRKVENVTAIKNLTQKVGIEFKELSELTSEECMNEIIKYSPYMIKTTNIGVTSYDGEPGKQTISGYDGLSLILLRKIFQKIEMFSASFSEYHYEIFEWFNIPIAKEKFNPTNNEFKDDYGCFFFHTEHMTPEKLHTISSKLGKIMHFATNTSDAKKLSTSLSNNRDTRYNFMSVEKVLFNEIKAEAKLTEKVYEAKDKDIIISYWGSSLSTGVNLPEIDICSINLKISVPFVFLPKSAVVDSDTLLYHINLFLSNSIEQMASRICRGKGDRFKFIIINKTASKHAENNRETFIEFFVKTNSFKKKFKNFDKIHGFTASDFEIALLENYRKLNIPLLLPENDNTIFVKDIWENENPTSNIQDELIRFGIQLNRTELNKYTAKLPKEHQDLKKIFNREQLKGNKTSWFEQLMQKNIMLIHTTLSTTDFVIDYRELHNPNFSTTIINRFDSREDVKKKIKKFTQIIDKDTVFVGFTNEMYDGPLLNILLNPKDTENVFQEMLTVLGKNRPPMNKIRKLSNYWIDLRVMCKQRNRLSLYDVGTQLHLNNLPSFTRELSEPTAGHLDEIQINNRRCVDIIERLFFNLFRYEEIEQFNSLLKLLEDDYDHKPTFDSILGYFTNTPIKRWESLIVDVIDISHEKNKKVFDTKIKNTKQLELIDQLHWHNSYIKDSLKNHFEKTIVFKKVNNKTTFLFNDDQPIECVVAPGDLTLTIKLGGIRSKNVNVELPRSDDKRVYYMDLIGFYSNAIKKFRLLERHSQTLQNFFDRMVDKRTKAIKSGNNNLGQSLKFMLNVISGQLSTESSVYYNPQSRIELIQLTQIIACNWIDLLLNQKCDIFSVHTDGLIVETESNFSFEFLEEWSENTGFRIKNEELIQFRSNTSGDTIKRYVNGVVEISGLNLDTNILPSTKFTFSKPLIIKSLLEKNDSVFNQELIDIDHLRNLIYLIKSKNTDGLEIQQHNKSVQKCNQLRYIRAIDPNFTLSQLNKEIVNIIPLHRLTPIKAELIDWGHYKSLVDFNHSQFIQRKYLPSPIKVNKNDILPTLLSFYSMYKDKYNFIPKIAKGNLTGSISSNIISDGKIVENAVALAIIANKESVFVIDVDNNQKFSGTIKKYICNNLDSMCISYHSTKDLDPFDIIHKYSFKLFFRCNETIYKKLFPLQRLYSNISTEIDFRKDFTVIGHYRTLSGSTYKFSGGRNLGNIEYPSDELINLLFQFSRTLPLDSPRTNTTHFIRNATKYQANNIISAFTREYGDRLDVSKRDNQDHTKIVSHCPYAELHNTKSSNTDFDISYKKHTRTLFIGCFHTSCKAKLKPFINTFINKHFTRDTYDELMSIDEYSI